MVYLLCKVFRFKSVICNVYIIVNIIYLFFIFLCGVDFVYIIINNNLFLYSVTSHMSLTPYICHTYM